MRRYFLVGLFVFTLSTVSASADDKSDCRGVGLFGSLNPDISIAACTRVIASGKSKGSDLANTFNLRGLRYSSKLEHDKAIADFNEALRLEPRNDITFYNRGMSYGDKQDYDRAIADFNESIRLVPKNSSVFLGRASVYAAKNDHDRAIVDFNESIRIDGKNALAFLLRGDSYLALAKPQFDKAIQDYTESIRLDPKNKDAFVARGSAYARIHDHDRAMVDYNDAMRLDPNKVDAYLYNQRGISSYQLQNYASCVSDLGQAIRLNPTSAVLRETRGRCYLNKADYDLAISDFDEAIRLDPKLVSAAGYRTTAVKLRDEKTAKAGPVSPPAEVKPSVAPATVVAKADVAPVISSTPLPIGKRVALVMGNGAYKNVPQLENTITDARTMRDVLKKLNFEVVYGENLDKRGMGRLIGEFGTLVQDAEAAVVYYAGHGSTFSDVPYVVPVDSKYQDLSQIPSELVQVESLVSELRKAKGVRLVVLDACRDNEREIQLRQQEAALRGDTKRGGSVTRGLAPLQNPNGLIVVYATQHLSTAADGAVGGNSPFTGALARYLVTPNLDIKDVLFRAGQDVIAKTGGTQRPEISISLYEPYMLVR